MEMNPSSYIHYPNRPAQVTPEFLIQEYNRLKKALPDAEKSSDADGWLRLVSEWNSLRALISGEYSRRSYQLSKNVRDTAVEEEEKYFREKILPVSEEQDLELTRALLQSRYKDALSEKHGHYFLKKTRISMESIRSENSDLRVQERGIVTDYDKAIGTAEVEVGGKKITLTQAASLQGSDDGKVRKEAYLKHRTWLLEHRPRLADWYDRLVKIRDQMGRNLGHPNFVSLGYAGMCRTDYGIEESKKFRNAVRRYVTPLYEKSLAAQARAHGTPTLMAWDAGYYPGADLPSGIIPPHKQLDAAARVFQAISPRLARHFERMRAEGLIDLENRPGKRGGAYCTSFPDEGRVAIFCNSTGDADDIGTLTHEMGHAFQAWESQAIELIDLQWPTMDAAEIHSMGMEFLSLRHLHHFFDEENSRKFRAGRWRESLRLLCYVSVVDEFQHWVYENPTATPDARDREWIRIWDTYIRGIDFTGIEALKSTRWYAQGHLFAAPFYYIDYAIAETGAMQLALIDRENPARAVETYLELCRIGGTRGVLDIFRSAGMRTPFDETLIRDLMEHAEQEMNS